MNPYKTLDDVLEPGDEIRTMNINSEENAQKRKTIIKNFLLLSTSIMVLFLASQSMDKLQSSVHFEEHLGTTVLAIINIVNFLVSLFIAARLIKKFGPKAVLLVSMVGYILYVAVNFYANWYTYVPVAVIDGLATACLYAALWTYIGKLGLEYSKVSSLPQDVIYARFYSLAFMFIQSNSIWGNLISYEVLDQSSQTLNSSNVTCGACFCDYKVPTQDSNFKVPEHFFLLCGIFVGACVLAMAIVMFVDKQEPTENGDTNFLQGILETVKKVKDPYMLLVLPVTLYGGLQFSFIIGDYTKAYITCEFGVADVGFVFICFGVVSTLFSAVCGHLVKILGRKAIFVTSAVMDIGIYFTLAFYSSWSNSLALLFVLIGLLGITNSVWQAQVKALYGTLFPDCQEVAFSLLGVFEALGIALGYLYSGQLCTQPKLFILMSLLVLSMVCYVVVEIKLKRRTVSTFRIN